MDSISGGNSASLWETGIKDMEAETYLALLLWDCEYYTHWLDFQGKFLANTSPLRCLLLVSSASMSRLCLASLWPSKTSFSCSALLLFLEIGSLEGAGFHSSAKSVSYRPKGHPLSVLLRVPHGKMSTPDPASQATAGWGPSSLSVVLNSYASQGSHAYCSFIHRFI